MVNKFPKATLYTRKIGLQGWIYNINFIMPSLFTRTQLPEKPDPWLLKRLNLELCSWPRKKYFPSKLIICMSQQVRRIGRFQPQRPDSSRSNNCSNYEITGSRAVLENSEIHYSCTWILVLGLIGIRFNFTMYVGT